jgi:hypothetical protein
LLDSSATSVLVVCAALMRTVKLLVAPTSPWTMKLIRSSTV